MNASDVYSILRFECYFEMPRVRGIIKSDYDDGEPQIFEGADAWLPVKKNVSKVDCL